MTGREATDGNRSGKAFAIVGLALVAAGALAAGIGPASADPVSVAAPQAPSFADVVEAVSPAVVSVRVKSAHDNDGDAPSSALTLGFGPGDGPTDHDRAMKRLFRGFGSSGAARPSPPPRDGPPRRRGARPISQGSGFLVSSDGYVVTNDHIVGGGEMFSVILDDGTAVDARLVGRDRRTDLAVLKIEDAERDFTYVGFADDASVRTGDWVVSVGNPFGLGCTVTAGIVSALGRDIGAGPYDDFIQVDSAVDRGSSGGPAFDLSGRVIGVNTAIFSPSSGNVGVAFAIPASTAGDVVSELIRDGRVQRGWLGVEIQPVDRDVAESLGLSRAAGALVADIAPHTPAKKAGLAAGDVVTSVDGDAVSDPKDLARTIAAVDPGKTVRVGLWRDGRTQTVKVEIGKLPSTGGSARSRKTGDDDTGSENRRDAGQTTLDDFGLTVVPSEDGSGAVVTEVDPNSPAEERGLRAGDLIVSVNNEAVASASDIVSVIGTAARQGRRAALFRVENDNHSRFIALPIDLG